MKLYCLTINAEKTGNVEKPAENVDLPLVIGKNIDREIDSCAVISKGLGGIDEYLIRFKNGSVQFQFC